MLMEEVVIPTLKRKSRSGRGKEMRKEGFLSEKGQFNSIFVDVSGRICRQIIIYRIIYFAYFCNRALFPRTKNEISDIWGG